jgi:uncharacterized membrane protein/predicted DsbA family dithiol-disulfide isomerase
MLNAEKTYTLRVRAITLNRILIILGVIGIFVASALSYMHFRELEIPCGADGGCNTVARHPSSYIGPIPNAFLGLAGYVLLTALAVFRSLKGLQKSSTFVAAGYFISAIGMLYSVYLQYVSIFQIRATCKWCISSAITMIATFVVYVMLFNEVGKKDAEEFKAPSTKFDLMAGGIGTILALVLVPAVFMNSKRFDSKIEELKVDEISTLIPEKRNQLGPDDAKITIVEFADLCCPTCRNSFGKLQKWVIEYPKNLRVVYRHYPLISLPGHEQTMLASFTSELAADKGKFWEFASAFVATDEAPKTAEEVFEIAESVGLSRNDIRKAIDAGDNEKTKTDAEKRVSRDQADAMKQFNVAGTPTYILVVPGKPIRKMTGRELEDLMQSSEIQAILKS